jgi:hypothetical protein
MIPTITDAIRSLAPDAAFSVDAGAIVAWESSVPQPSQPEIHAELARLTALYVADEWKRNRQAEYPGLDALIVALWESSVEGRPASAAELQAIREAIKLKYPKPGA